jgi:uncharacterized protein (TIGR04168 family)
MLRRTARLNNRRSRANGTCVPASRRACRLQTLQQWTFRLHRVTLRIGIIGDLHSHWDEVDVLHLGNSDYDLLFFIGDLGGGTRESTLRVARTISRLPKPTLVLPGNNDTWDLAELTAELTHRAGIRRLTQIRDGVDAGPEPFVRLCGFTAHRLTSDSVDVTLITGRPHSMGGLELSFPEHMLTYYGVDTMEAARQRLRALVDQAETHALVFCSHNGPRGLGDQPEDMWGCDFKPGGGDWGDPDLADAVDYAIGKGHQVLAVVAGHMHLRTKTGGERPWIRQMGGVTYVNSARVPRISSDGNSVRRHHLALTIDRTGATVEERYLG